MNLWLDKTFGRHGQWIWISGLAPFVFVGIFLWIVLHPKHASYVSYLLIFGVLWLTPTIWICFYISQVRMALQEVMLNGDRLLVKFFYGRKLEIKASDIASISYYAMTWRIRQINLYDRNKPGIEIKLKDGTVMRVNAKIEGFDGLVDALRNLSATGEIRCEL